MRNNFIITYDLNRPGQDYSRIHDAIKSLGSWYHLQYSTFYVNTAYSLAQCDAIIGAVLDPNDRLLIGDPRTLYVRGISQADIRAINRVWFSNAATQAA